jgi:hypothetical protein
MSLSLQIESVQIEPVENPNKPKDLAARIIQEWRGGGNSKRVLRPALKEERRALKVPERRNQAFLPPTGAGFSQAR